jgi:hypothetical protein
LAQELQAAQAQVAALTAENQQLSEQNRQLRHEIDRLLGTAQDLQKFLIALDSAADLSRSSPQAIPQKAATPPTLPNRPPQIKEPVSAASRRQVMEVDDRSRSLCSSTHEVAINGWMLAITITLIVLTSCMGAFFLVNARLGNNNHGVAEPR